MVSVRGFFDLAPVGKPYSGNPEKAMNYFHPYPLPVDDSPATAWRSQLAEVENTPWLASTLAGRASELFPRFVTAYTELRALPRGVRRSIQRQLARSRDVLERAPQWLERGEGRRRRYKLARSLAGAALLLALGQSAQAAMITVTTNKPGINDGDGQCSLIEAIVNANNDAATHPDCAAGSGADTIVLPPGSTHTLSAPYTNYHGYTGLPVISSQITIQGNGSKITRKKSRKLNRLIAVASTGDLTLDKVTLSNGLEYYGGAVYNLGTLTITNSTISGNVGFFGGGVFNGMSGNATIESCALTKNTGGIGGAIRNRGGTITISNSTITSNKVRSGGQGGGVSHHQGTTSIVNSEISGNRASAAGGGVQLTSGSVTIENSTIMRNKGQDVAGGIWVLNSGDLTVVNSTISGNRTVLIGGGGVTNQGGNVVIRGSTVSGNKTGDDGGGLDNEFGTFTVADSTVSGNNSAKKGGGVLNSGIFTLLNSTISNNNAMRGGGVYNFGRITLKGSVISGNKASSGAEISKFVSSSSTVTANDFNLFGANGNSGVTGFTPGATDIVPTVPVASILSPLANNGGPTMTHALVPGSPAIDAIAGADPECTGTDQRGTTRPQGVGCDIGAFEE